MSKKDITTGEEFEDFLSFAIRYKVEKKSPKQKDIKLTTEKCRAELEKIASELKLPIENPGVIIEWGKRGGRYNDKIFVELIAPLYFPTPDFDIIINEDGQHAAVQKK